MKVLITKDFMMIKFLGLLPLLFSILVHAQVRPVAETRIPAGDFPLAQYGKVAVLQWAPSDSAPLGDLELAKAYKERNIKVLDHYIREAHSNGAEMVVTPEFGIVGYPDIPDLPSHEDNFRNRDDIRPYVESVPGPATEHFQSLALELDIIIHFGLAEVDLDTNRYYNTVVAIGSDGEILARYRKQNLFQLERNFLSAGIENITYESPFGSVGIIICADVYDSRVMSRYAQRNLSVIALSTSWAQYNTGWNYFTRGAITTKATMLASNHNYFPDSGVINPDGSVQSHIRQSSGLAYGYLKRVNP
jgi:predicted amidohydrolase